MKLGTCEDGVEGEGAVAGGGGGSSLLLSILTWPPPSTGAKALQPHESGQAQHPAQGPVERGTHSYLWQRILRQLHRDKFIATIRDVVFGLVC